MLALGKTCFRSTSTLQTTVRHFSTSHLPSPGNQQNGLTHPQDVVPQDSTEGHFDGRGRSFRIFADQPRWNPAQSVASDSVKSAVDLPTVQQQISVMNAVDLQTVQQQIRARIQLLGSDPYGNGSNGIQSLNNQATGRNNLADHLVGKYPPGDYNM